MHFQPLTTVALAVLFGGVALTARAGQAGGADRRRPNVLLIITDDQGFGDLSSHGNPVLQTPNLDRLARQGVRLTQFYVSPVCSPTRASLLTGRYNYRTGVVDTFLGRSMMDAAEVTLAEMLRDAGYRTGIFGKWHLGDNHPMRPGEQGFAESLVLRGGGLGQPSDFPGGGDYFDPVLLRNGKPERQKGYVSDVVTDAAMAFVEANRREPFFAYVAFNAPHDPLDQVPRAAYEKYRAADYSPQRHATENGRPLPASLDADRIARVYAMVANIDENVGRLLKQLDALELERDTIVVFLTDNGPAFPRYNGGLRGLKGTVYDGGTRVPCFVRWPAGLGRVAGTSVDRVAAHIDLAPTLLDACGVPPRAGVRFDGVSLLGLLMGEVAREAWPDRTLCFQWHRGDAPQPGRAFAVRSQRWKLVRAAGVAEGSPLVTKYELFDMAADPFESQDRAAERPEVVEELRGRYERWFAEVTAGRPSPRIVVGTPHENPTVLTRQDWRGPRAGWRPKDLGYWDIEVAEAGKFEVTVRLARDAGAGGDGPRTAHLRVGGVDLRQPVEPGQNECRFGPFALPAGVARVEPWITVGDGDAAETVGVWSAELAKVE